MVVVDELLVLEQWQGIPGLDRLEHPDEPDFLYSAVQDARPFILYARQANWQERILHASGKAAGLTPLTPSLTSVRIFCEAY